ncbi:hypothetical protein Y032_0021g437 [Ancylostoma ceylanicum]|uniref:Uncharacterized protein n=1 Tax=Ancylostoma ceylanicum TaxID=53326 RepID=A0A016V0L9_9BILA|nr:hypothetical protein Y032_0021g437 [Ancylostoma ceylanicum]
MNLQKSSLFQNNRRIRLGPAMLLGAATLSSRARDPAITSEHTVTPITASFSKMHRQIYNLCFSEYLNCDYSECR